MFNKFKAVKAYRKYTEGDNKEIVLIPVKDEKTGKTVYKTEEGAVFFTQDHMNYEISNARKSARQVVEAEKSNLQKELEQMRTEAEEKGLNVDALSNKIKELEEANMTAEELSAKRTKELEARFNAEREGLQKQASQYQSLYAEERITTEINNACIAHKAVASAGSANPYEIITPLIRANTELVAEKDRKGEVTGYKVVVHFTEKDAEGQTITTDLSVHDAVKRMREMPERFGPLFLHETEEGSGRTTLYGKTESSSLDEKTTTQAQFDAKMKAMGL